jgi:uncharacterized protein (DUF342 family)
MEMAGKDEPDSGVSFFMSEDGNKLLAVLEPKPPVEPIDRERVHQILADRGFADLFIVSDAVDRLVKQYNSGAGLTLVVGERRDGAFSILINEDRMSAQLTMTPAYGGKPVSADQIHAEMREKGITFGILDDTIQAAVGKGYARNKLIAEGVPPLQGDDAQFISLIREIENARLPADDTETIDYRNIGNLITVKQGDPLMRRMPPTEGRPGMNILGSPVPAQKGNDIRFSQTLSGAEIHKDDPDLLVAAISGQPFPLPNGVNVEPVITLKDVDLSTGNLDIEGTLKITGDVKPGMRVKATADIVIGGMVEAAHIEAGGAVEVRGAIIGHGEPRIGAEELNPSAATVRAEGSVKALFVENAVISSDADIVIREFVMKSELNAANSILVGESGSSKGRIINSLCRAGSRIETITIGSRAGIGTVLEVGADPSVQDRFIAAKQALHCKERELAETCKALEYFRENPNRSTPDAVQEKENAILRLQTEIKEVTGKLKRLKKRFELPDNACIKAERQVYCGARIRIGEKSFLVDSDMEGVTFTVGEDGIVF